MTGNPTQPGKAQSSDLRSPQRTPIQRDADSIDSDLYRVMCRVEELYKNVKRIAGRHPGPRVTDLEKSLQAIRGARTGIRMLMHDYDRARTI